MVTLDRYKVFYAGYIKHLICIFTASRQFRQDHSSKTTSLWQLHSTRIDRIV